MAVAMLAAAGVGSACQVLIGIGDDRFTVATEAGVDAAPDAAPDAGPGCQFAGPPEKPDAADEADDGKTHVFAIRSTNVTGKSDAGAIVGVDLDGVCTCDLRDNSPRAGTRSCKPTVQSLSNDECDHDGGIDNALVRLFESVRFLAEFQSFSEATSRQGECGRLNLLIFVTGYNGKLNDPKVDVAVIESFGIREPHSVGDPDEPRCSWVADAGKAFGPFPARFDGTDKWSVRAGAVTRPATGNPMPLKNIGNGWVKDNRLVYDGRNTRERSIIPLLFGSDVVNVGSPVLTARLVPVDSAGVDLAPGPDGTPIGVVDHYRLTDGLFVGRAPVDEVLSRAGALRVGSLTAPDEESYFCSPNNSLIYQTTKSNLCSGPDVMADQRDDFSDRTCNALSITLQFEATHAQVGIPFDPPTPDAGCGPGWRDQCP